MAVFRKILRLFSAVASLAIVLPGMVAWAQSEKQRSNAEVVFKDFVGRRIPTIAHELINLEVKPEIPGIMPARLPGWLSVDTGVDGVNEFEGDPSEELLASAIWVQNLNKKADRIGVIRKLNPDKSWKVSEVVARTKQERLSAICERKGHDIPPGQVFVGVLNQGDPHRLPAPPRPTTEEQRKYMQENDGREHPRSCMANLQTARYAAVLDLQAGKLTRYLAKPVVCVSPFSVVCK